MKVLKVRFKNLNSLVGEWTIDFTHKEFEVNGIFAITGPTGSGKTTILDAICLALYGQTPRLSKITKSSNEIMSRDTGECFAEVAFSTEAGQFLCHWSQQRAHKKPDGALQSQRHEISNLVTGEVLESKLKDVAKKVEEVTGMDFDRFTRSMMLAQGNFASFLLANPDDRSPILEQITGAEIYSRISIAVHNRQRDENEALDRQIAALKGVSILTADEEAAVRQKLQTKQAEATKQTDLIKELELAVNWLKGLDALRNELRTLGQEREAFQGQLAAFKPQQARLDLALKAASLDGIFATLLATRSSQQADVEALKKVQEGLPGLSLAVEKQGQVLGAAEVQTVLAKKALEDARPLLQQVRALDLRLGDLVAQVAKAQEGYNRDLARLKEGKRRLLEEEAKLLALKKQLQTVDEYLKTNANDQWLVAGLAGITVQIRGLCQRQAEIATKQRDAKGLSKELERAQSDLARQRGVIKERKDLLDAALASLDEGKTKLEQVLDNRLLRELREKLDGLVKEQIYLNKIAELTEHRAKLHDGQPCPLCGSVEHPYALGNVPVADEVEQKIEALRVQIRQAEVLESRVSTLDKAVVSAKESLAEAEKAKDIAKLNELNIAKSLVAVKDDLGALQKLYEAQSSELLEKLALLEMQDVGDLDSLSASLQKRLADWTKYLDKRAELERQIGGLDGEIKALAALVESQTELLAEKLTALDAHKAGLVQQQNEREKIFGDKNPDKQEQLLSQAVTTNENQEKLERQRHGELTDQLKAAMERIKVLSDQIAQREVQLAGMEAGFLTELASCGFDEEATFMAARLEPEVRARLLDTSRALERQRAELDTKIKDRNNRLEAELAKNLTGQDLKELESSLKELGSDLAATQEVVAQLKYQLDANANAVLENQSRQREIEAQRIECRRWDNLKELIGSADGKKFRNFAQGLTFEIMVGLANQQLQRMSDRYLLVRDKSEPLELNVIDSYQGGQIRSTRNLSGGESFIVSLALALGLSQMSSRNIKLDSLFLDEGFGSLDEDALQTALDTLASLQGDGKLIGIISHVPALKERISTQIQVEPKSSGKSRLFGPGCSG